MTTIIAINLACYKPQHQHITTTQDSTTSLWTSNIIEIFQPDCPTWFNQSVEMTLMTIKAFFSSHWTGLRTLNRLSSSKSIFWARMKPSGSLSLRSMSRQSSSTNLRNASLSLSKWIAARKTKTQWNRNSSRNRKSCKCVCADRTQST